MAACLAKQREHVVEEADAGGDVDCPAPSRFSSTWISVSAVLRSMVAVRGMGGRCLVVWVSRWPGELGSEWYRKTHDTRHLDSHVQLYHCLEQRQAGVDLVVGADGNS